MRRFLCIICILLFTPAGAQVLGGRSVFNFLRLSHTPQLTALGGVNVVGLEVFKPVDFFDAVVKVLLGFNRKTA